MATAAMLRKTECIRGDVLMKTDEKDGMFSITSFVFELVTSVCTLHNVRVAIAYSVGPVKFEEISAEDYSAVKTMAETTKSFILPETRVAPPLNHSS